MRIFDLRPFHPFCSARPQSLPLVRNDPAHNCGAGRFEWSEDPPRLHRRVRLLKLPCQTHWLVDENLLAEHDAVAAHRRLDQIAHLETDRIADVLGDGDLELRADLGCSACHGYESPTYLV